MDRRSFLSASATVALLPLAEAPVFALATRPGSGDSKLNALFEQIFQERVRNSPEVCHRGINRWILSGRWHWERLNH